MSSQQLTNEMQNDCEMKVPPEGSEVILLTSLHLQLRMNFQKVMDHIVNVLPEWYVVERMKFSHSFIKRVADHIWTSPSKYFGGVKEDHKLLRCKSCLEPLKIPSINHRAAEMKFWWPRGKFHDTIPEEIEMVICEMCFALSSFVQHDITLFLWARGYYGLSSFSSITSKLKKHNSKVLHESKPLYKSSIARLSRADVAAIPQNGSTIDFVLLKAQYELQRGLVIYPSHSTGSDSSLIARLLRAAHVMKSATKPLRFKSILPSEVENVMKKYPGMLKNIPTQQQLLTDTNNHLPHFEDTELMYTFFAIPLNVTKDANPISRWEIIANDPNHPISSTNFLITTQFLKHAEEKFGRSSVSLWL